MIDSSLPSTPEATVSVSGMKGHLQSSQGCLGCLHYFKGKEIKSSTLSPKKRHLRGQFLCLQVSLSHSHA